MSDSGVREDYLRIARDADLLGLFQDRPYVAGTYRDPVTGQDACLVEYCHPDILRESAAEFAGMLLAQFSAVSQVLLRIRAGTTLPDPWQPLVTYVRYASPGGDTAPAAGPVAVIEGSPAHSGAVERWLVQAIRDAYASQQREAPEPAVRAAAREIISAPGRRSYLAMADGRAIGHLTILADSYDDVSGETYTDLVDMLVEPGDLARPARESLVRRAVADASRAGRALIGNVTHPLGADGAHGQRVLAALVSRGWRVDHADWMWPRP